MAKRARKGAPKATRRTRRARAGRGPDQSALVLLTPVGRWQAQMQRLQEWRARMEATPSMHGPQWRAGVLRHIDALIATHESNKPPTA